MTSARYKSTADYATAAIRQMILVGDLKPGMRVDQNEMASLLDISRHPVRQAIERLAERGFVQSRPHKSVIVADLSEVDMRQLYAARQVLEDMAIRLAWPRYNADFLKQCHVLIAAMERANDLGDLDAYMTNNYDFHMNFYRHCGNVHINRVIESLFQLSERYQRTALMHQSRATRAREEHLSMIDAVASGTLESLLGICARHNTGTMATVSASLGAPGPGNAAAATA